MFLGTLKHRFPIGPHFVLLMNNYKSCKPILYAAGDILQKYKQVIKRFKFIQKAKTSKNNNFLLYNIKLILSLYIKY